MHKSGVEALVLNWNRLAMDHLREDQLAEALRLLQKAEELLKYPDGADLSKLQAITYNNFGCYYRKCHKFPTALKYLTKALDIEVISISDKTNIAGAHLNICSVYSSMNQHEKALSHGILAVRFLKEANEVEKNSTTLVSLVVALNNTGYEYEALKENNNALNTYKCGLDLASKHLGQDHQITSALFKSYSNLLSSFNYKTTKSKVQIIKKKTQGLPNLKSLSVRNKSVGSRSKFIYSANDKNGHRTGSNKIFAENIDRKNLPAIDKPRTVIKRKKRVIRDDKVMGLEDKITELQNQISNFQKKYKDLEAQVSRKLSKQQAAVIIQRFWRKYIKKFNIAPSSKAKFAIRELERIKKYLPNEQKKPIPPSQIKSKDNYEIFNTKSLSNYRNYKPIRIPLDPIRESKLETKEMKAVLIQSVVRQFLSRKHFKRIKMSAVKIQRAFRAFQCRKLFNDIKEAIICIQRFWRSYKEKSIL